jgi:hypothetical protein
MARNWIFSWKFKRQISREFLHQRNRKCGAFNGIGAAAGLRAMSGYA